jgi:hypothetical protein
MTRPLVAGLALALGSVTLAGQSLATRVDAVRDGVVLFQFDVRTDVCGGNEDNYRSFSRTPCAFGPAHVRLVRSSGETIALHFRVGGRPDGSGDETDLGALPAPDAARYLVSTARTLGPRNAERALGAASTADAPAIGGAFLALARARDVPIELRKTALFWAGQSSLPLAQLVAAYPDLRDHSLREHFTFVLSQRPERAAVEKLIDIVQHDDDRDVRRQAIFWLGQTKDPRARDFLRDLIAKGGDT